MSGIATVPAFKESGLAQAIAEEAHIQYVGELVIENENALSVVLADPSSVSTGVEISMTVSGNAQLLAVYDGQKLVQDLAGKRRPGHYVGGGLYPAIESLLVRIYPFGEVLYRQALIGSKSRLMMRIRAFIRDSMHKVPRESIWCDGIGGPIPERLHDQRG